jgi:hypothetical protein
VGDSEGKKEEACEEASREKEEACEEASREREYPSTDRQSGNGKKVEFLFKLIDGFDWQNPANLPDEPHQIIVDAIEEKFNLCVEDLGVEGPNDVYAFTGGSWMAKRYRIFRTVDFDEFEVDHVHWDGHKFDVNAGKWVTVKGKKKKPVKMDKYGSKDKYGSYNDVKNLLTDFTYEGALAF